MNTTQTYALCTYVSAVAVCTLFGIVSGCTGYNKLKLQRFEWSPTTKIGNILCGTLGGFLLGIVSPLLPIGWLFGKVEINKADETHTD